ncbi:hypothetical protein DR64_7927 [Paraburkholderia xenovorans LB400]|uniref:DUF2889 domain-containing protein n=1 Tax=Paraburkholderia xenovorans (strain LB400) TaxID=266265 RepID=Q13HM0_PARXL|nr:DUF2889 domain-containing protein [Paraburkholderia xenovorans]ABE36419.1 Conserved hypothetical protein [Paraburkholderia xenovorans LB400]AIP34613.1 hypothetical protein DR64_7927 [Paraburkholderia xenovorans LB400]
MTAERKHLHSRCITCEAYLCEDGSVELEGMLTDTKSHPFNVGDQGVLPTGHPVHQMLVRLRVASDFRITEAEARTIHGPYRVCGDIAPQYSKLVGLTIGPGFNALVKRMFRERLGCTHLTELLPVIATVAYQAIWSEFRSFEKFDPANAAERRSTPLGGCHALQPDGEVVRLHFPDRYKPPDPSA